MNLNDLPVGAATNVITRIRLENEEVVNQPNVRHGRSEREVRMEEEVKEQIKAMLLLLANTLQNNFVSMACDKNGNLYFFDTETYLREGKYSGLRVNIQDLVGSNDEIYTEPL